MYVFYEKVGETLEGKVIELRQEDEIEEIRKQEGIQVESVPPYPPDGGVYELFIDLEVAELFYKKIERENINTSKIPTFDVKMLEQEKIIKQLTQDNIFLEQQLFSTETELIKVNEDKSFLEGQLFDIETRLLAGGL